MQLTCRPVIEYLDNWGSATRFQQASCIYGRTVVYGIESVVYWNPPPSRPSRHDVRGHQSSAGAYQLPAAGVCLLVDRHRAK